MLIIRGILHFKICQSVVRKIPLMRWPQSFTRSFCMSRNAEFRHFILATIMTIADLWGQALVGLWHVKKLWLSYSRQFPTLRPVKTYVLIEALNKISFLFLSKLGLLIVISLVITEITSPFFPYLPQAPFHISMFLTELKFRSVYNLKLVLTCKLFSNHV